MAVNVNVVEAAPVVETETVTTAMTEALVAYAEADAMLAKFKAIKDEATKALLDAAGVDAMAASDEVTITEIIDGETYVLKVGAKATKREILDNPLIKLEEMGLGDQARELATFKLTDLDKYLPKSAVEQITNSAQTGSRRLTVKKT